MVNVLHKNLTGADAVHPFGFVQSTDPGAVGANLCWIDTSVGPPYVLRLRNVSNTGWLVFTTGPSGPVGPQGVPGPPNSFIVSGVPPYVNVQDVKVGAASSGGTFTSGAWRTRTLNSLMSDTLGISSLNNNQVTLPAGIYRCMVSAPAYAVADHLIRLQNITDGVTLGRGTTEYSANGGAQPITQSRSVLSGRFSLSGQKVIEVQHYCGVTQATNGFGVGAANSNALDGGAESYTMAEFWLEGTVPPFFSSTALTEVPSFDMVRRRATVANMLIPPAGGNG